MNTYNRDTFQPLSLKSPNILIIDDNEDNLISISALLKQRLPESNIFSETSALAGIETARKKKIELILLDIYMPEMDGFECCKILKENTLTSFVPIIFITAVQPDSKLRQKCIDYGAEMFFSKPIDGDLLVKHIQSIITTKLDDNSESVLKNPIVSSMELDNQIHLNKIILDSIPSNIMLLNKNRQILSANKSAYQNGARIGSFCWETFSGNCFHNSNRENYFDQEMKRCVFCKANQAMESGETQKLVFSNNLIWEINWIPIDTERFIHISRNITEKVTMEKKQIELQEQLFRAQKLKSLGTLAGGIAHDFNNLLTPINGFAELIIETSPPELSASNYAKKILKAGTRAKELVNQILTFSRKTEKKVDVVELSVIINEVTKMLDSLFPSNIKLSKDFIKTSNVKAVSSQIHQVIMNLCTNAYQAIGNNPGEITVTLDCENIFEPAILEKLKLLQGEYSTITISDTGNGINPENIGRIFEPYYTSNELKKGTGLGLAVVHGIVYNHDGAISVESTVGIGTSFKIFLPITEDCSIEKLNIESHYLKSGTETVMIVDDEPMIVDLIKMLIEKLGYKTLIAENGQCALDLFMNNHDTIDLVLTDMTMPVINGLELSKKLLKIKSTLPIIIYSGYSEYIDKKIIEKEGIKGYMRKPFKLETLSTEIRRILDQNQ